MTSHLENLTLKRPTPLEEFSNEIIKNAGVKVYIKRDDLIHPYITGNKWRKLKYNLIEAFNQQKSTLLTFGGAFSNHIYATAAAGAEFGFKTIGIIRGEEPTRLSSTLNFAKYCGMHLHFLSRTDYLLKTNPIFVDKLRETYGDFYLIPEGGTNSLALLGVKEIIEELDIDHNFICASVGTGGTIAGLSLASADGTILGFSALKGGDFLEADVKKLITNSNHEDKATREWLLNFHFGGYGKISAELKDFINSFPFPLDPVYTGKMMFGLLDLIKSNYFMEGSRIVFYHSGGLQGRNF